MEQPARTDFEFFCPLRVRYAEVDAQGIVFNAHYLTYFDVAVTEYFRQIGFPYEKFTHEHGIDFHVVQSLVNYRSPARFDEQLEIGVSGHFRGPRVFWKIAVFRGSNLLCWGELTYACFAASSGRPTKLDRAVAAKIGLSSAVASQGRSL